MKVTVNDKAVDVDEQMTIAALLESLGFPEKGIAVAVDWSVLPRSQWETALTDGARVEACDLLGEQGRVLTGGKSDDRKPILVRGDDIKRALPDRSRGPENGNPFHRRQG